MPVSGTPPPSFCYKTDGINSWGFKVIAISVILPIYNMEKYLSTCLDSIVNQDLKNIEIICINDGSTDASFSILEEYAKKDNRIIIINQDNKGAAIARNEGLIVATGEYIHFMDADDFVVEQAYSLVYEKAKSNELDIIRTKSYALRDGEVVKQGDLYGLDLLSDNDFNSIFNFKNNLTPFLAVTVTPWAGLFRRNLLLDNNIKFFDLTCVNDRSFWVAGFINATKVMFVHEYLVYHRISVPSSLVSRRAEFFHCHFDSYNIIRNLVKNLPTEKQEQILFNEILDIFHWYSKFENSKYSEEIKKQTTLFLQNLEKENQKLYKYTSKTYGHVINGM
jgi:glycosyltransferase involved in cell wall biosynthesis